MGHLDQIIDFGALADHRPTEPGTVEGAIGADLDIVLDNNGAHLRNLFVTSAHKFISKSIGADHHSGLQTHPVP